MEMCDEVVLIASITHPVVNSHVYTPFNKQPVIKISCFAIK